MINIQPFIQQLDLLREYMDWKIDNPDLKYTQYFWMWVEMGIPPYRSKIHSTYTTPYKNFEDFLKRKNIQQ